MESKLSQQAAFEALNHARERFNQGDLIGVLDLIDTLPDDQKATPGVRRLIARTLAQAGQTHEARSIVCSLLERPDLLDDVSVPDLLALIGRTWKDEWQSNWGSPTEPGLLDQVLKSYLQALKVAESTPNSFHDLYYAAINVATFAHIDGRRDLAEQHARLVLDLCRDAESMLTGPNPNAWPLGSRAEAHALLGHVEEAAHDYAAMADSGLLVLRDLCSARKQARLVALHTGQDKHVFDNAFHLPSIVVFAGHRLDDPERQASFGPRLPPEVLDSVRTELDRVLARLDARISYSSAGADIVFLEAMQARNAETHILLSSPEESFRRTNLNNVLSGGWTARFDAVLDRARSDPGRGSVMAASPHEPSQDSVAYVYASLIMSGQALHRARHLDLDLHPVAVWDERRGDGPGGTADFCQTWARRGLMPTIINPMDLPRPGHVELGQKLAVGVKDHAKRGRTASQEIKAVLFADVKNFSLLSEDQVEWFTRHYMGRVSEMISQPVSCDLRPPLVCNTWGDAIYMVFDTVRDAGVFALRLQQALVPPPVGMANWAAHGLPENLSIRIALHAGPVFLFSDPVTRSLSFTGRHVSFGARLEPVTPPGQVYASEAFASLALMETVEEFECDYVGLIRAAKNFGTIRAFRVSPVRAAENFNAAATVES